MTPWALRWDGERLLEGRVVLPGGTAIVLRTQASEHVLFGACDVIGDGEGRVIARLGAVDWARPRSIPPLDVPGALPSGAGSAVLNLLSMQAQRANVPVLRYRGPYPTAQLFDTLRGSFAIAGVIHDVRTRFTANVEQIAFAGRSVEPAVDFVPDPHEWSWPDPRVCAQHRRGLERLWIEGRAWDRDGVGPRRLRREGDEWRAVFEIDGAPLCTVATVDEHGRLRAPPLRELPLPKACVGVELPPAAASVIGEALVAGAVPALRGAIAAIVRERTIVFGDSGFELATVEPARIVLHAALAERIEAVPPERSLALLVAALHGAVARAAQRRIAEAVGA